jgi:Xaa-Pro aminopeptidase
MTMKISVEEYRSRIAALQETMQQNDIDHLVAYSWKRGQTKFLAGYFPNYIANIAAVLVSQTGSPKLFIRFPFDLERAERESWIGDIRASGDPENMASDIAEDILANGKARGKVGIVSGDYLMDEMPHSFYARLRMGLPGFELIDQRAMLQDVRIIKTAAEITAVRKAAKLADEGLRAAKPWVRAGVSEWQVVAAVESALREGGADHHLVVIAAPGSQKLIGPPTNRELQENEDVIVEIAVEFEGYWSQVAAVFFTQPVSEERLQVSRVVYDAYKTLVAQIKPGMTCADLAGKARTYFEERGYGEYIEQDFGHGIGLDMPEPPKIELKDQTIIEPGMLLVVHPALRIPEKGGAFIGGTVVVGERTAEELHDLSILMEGV